MPSTRWNTVSDSPNWVRDAAGRVLGYNDDKGNFYSVPNSLASDPTDLSEVPTPLVHNNGQLDLVSLAAVRAGVAPREMVKRLAARSLVNNPIVNAVYSGVTVTAPATADAGLTNKFVSPDNVAGVTARPNVFAFYGGTRAQFPAQGWDLFPVSNQAPAVTGNLNGYLSTTPSLSAWTWCVEFCTDAPLLEMTFLAFTSTNVRVVIDSQYAQSTPIVPNAYTGVQQVRLDFGSVRKTRTIQFWGQGAVAWRGVNVTALDTVWVPDTSDVLKVAITGDSFGESIGIASPFDPHAGYANQLGLLMGWRDVRQVAVGSTGYVANASGARSTVAQQVANWNFKPDIILSASGFNDWGVAGETTTLVSNAALVTWQTMREKAPNAPIFVLGPWAGNRRGLTGAGGYTLQALDAALQAKFASWGDNNAYFASVVNDASPWTIGTGRVGTTNGTGNADIYISSDGIHPSAEGHLYHGQRAATAIRQIVNAW